MPNPSARSSRTKGSTHLQQDLCRHRRRIHARTRAVVMLPPASIVGRGLAIPPNRPGSTAGRPRARDGARSVGGCHCSCGRRAQVCCSKREETRRGRSVALRSKGEAGEAVCAVAVCGLRFKNRAGALGLIVGPEGKRAAADRSRYVGPCMRRRIRRTQGEGRVVGLGGCWAEFRRSAMLGRNCGG